MIALSDTWGSGNFEGREDRLAQEMQKYKALPRPETGTFLDKCPLLWKECTIVFDRSGELDRLVADAKIKAPRVLGRVLGCMILRLPESVGQAQPYLFWLTLLVREFHYAISEATLLDLEEFLVRTNQLVASGSLASVSLLMSAVSAEIRKRAGDISGWHYGFTRRPDDLVEVDVFDGPAEGGCKATP